MTQTDLDLILADDPFTVPTRPPLPRRIAGDILVVGVMVAIWAGTFAAIGRL